MRRLYTGAVVLLSAGLLAACADPSASSDTSDSVPPPAPTTQGANDYGVVSFCDHGNRVYVGSNASIYVLPSTDDCRTSATSTTGSGQ